MRFQGPNLETIEAQTGPSWGWLIFALANFLLICSALLFHWFTLLESMAFVSGMALGLACFRAEEAWLTSGNILKVRNLVWIVKSYDLSELKWIDVHAKNSIVLWIGEQVVSLSTDTSKRIKFRYKLDKIAREKFSYYGYRPAEKFKLVGGQSSGCLDCHEIFMPADFLDWKEFSKTLLNRTQKYWAVCPNCRAEKVYTNSVIIKPITKRGLREMSAVFKYYDMLPPR